MITMQQAIEVNQNAMKIRDILIPIRDEQDWYRKEKAVELSEAYTSWFWLQDNQPENTQAIKEANDRVQRAYTVNAGYRETYNSLENSLTLLSSIDCFIDYAMKP